MKTSTLLTAGLYVLLATRSLTAMAADPRVTTGPGSVPQRGLFGLPVPQQWTGGRAASNYRPAGYVPTGYNANCPSGNCQSGYGVQTGYAGQPGSGANRNCANGQCATGACANGQCATGNCVNGQCATGNCPNGNCGTSPYKNGRLPLGAQSDWSPRSSRTGLSDPYRRSGDAADYDGWTQRTQRPVLDDAFNSRYRREELDLRSDYFGSSSNDRPDYRSDYRPQSNDRPRLNSNEWNRPSRRSMEAPENSSGVARF
jgi:hypothetical protein